MQFIADNCSAPATRARPLGRRRPPSGSVFQRTTAATGADTSHILVDSAKSLLTRPPNNERLSIPNILEHSFEKQQWHIFDRLKKKRGGYQFV